MAVYTVNKTIFVSYNEIGKWIFRWRLKLNEEEYVGVFLFKKILVFYNSNRVGGLQALRGITT